LFLGAAGTGKTFITMEKARRSAAQGKKVLLTCFNKNLVQSGSVQAVPWRSGDHPFMGHTGTTEADART